MGQVQSDAIDQTEIKQSPPSQAPQAPSSMDSLIAGFVNDTTYVFVLDGIWESWAPGVCENVSVELLCCV